MTTQLTRSTELPQTATVDKIVDKPRYILFGSGPSEVWFAPRTDPSTWAVVSKWAGMDDARDAISRYLKAREFAKAMGARIR